MCAGLGRLYAVLDLFLSPASLPLDDSMWVHAWRTRLRESDGETRGVGEMRGKERGLGSEPHYTSTRTILV